METENKNNSVELNEYQETLLSRIDWEKVKASLGLDMENIPKPILRQLANGVPTDFVRVFKSGELSCEGEVSLGIRFRDKMPEIVAYTKELTPNLFVNSKTSLWSKENFDILSAVTKDYEYERDAEGNILKDEKDAPIIKRDKEGAPIVKRTWQRNANLGKPIYINRPTDGSMVTNEEGMPILYLVSLDAPVYAKTADGKTYHKRGTNRVFCKAVTDIKNQLLGLMNAGRQVFGHSLTEEEITRLSIGETIYAEDLQKYDGKGTYVGGLQYNVVTGSVVTVYNDSFEKQLYQKQKASGKIGAAQEQSKEAAKEQTKPKVETQAESNKREKVRRK